MFQPRAAIGVLLALAAIAVAENGDPCQDLLGAGGFLQFAAANGIVAAADCQVKRAILFYNLCPCMPAFPPPTSFRCSMELRHVLAADYHACERVPGLNR